MPIVSSTGPNVVIPNMGRHFLKGSLVDAKFEADRPELLVYSPHENGRMELVAVEYAVPLDLCVRVEALRHPLTLPHSPRGIS